MRITIRCPIFPTEATDIVINSIHHLVPNMEMELVEEAKCTWIQSEGTNETILVPLREMIHENRVIDAARKMLRKSWTGSTTIMKLDKQAACRQKLRLVDQAESPPLGTIDITISFEDDTQYDGFLTWFTPPTKDGKIVRG
ncbi:MAG: RNA-binding domain-containing protein [Candidatus Thorarchaeota archaeon]|nr:RNA-binding domain-containing protein [Candidatus Thorarchaeota archaeon]